MSKTLGGNKLAGLLINNYGLMRVASFATSPLFHLRRLRFSRTINNNLVPIGEMSHKHVPSKPYQPGQLFLHKLFCYQGIVLFYAQLQETKLFTKSSEEKSALESCRDNEEKISAQKSPYFYMVLIHQNDWNSYDYKLMTEFASLQNSNGPRDEKVLSIINGIDCVPHDEIIPFIAKGCKENAQILTGASNTTTSFEHPYFKNFFSDSLLRGDTEGRSFEHIHSTSENMSPTFSGPSSSDDILPSDDFDTLRREWTPQEIYSYEVDGINVKISIYYFGSQCIPRSTSHFWQYTMRITSLLPSNVIILDGQIRVTNSKNHDIKIDRTGFIASSKKFTRWNVQLTPNHPG